MSSEIISELLPDNKDISPSSATTSPPTTTTTLEFKSNTNNSRELSDDESDQEDFFASLEKSVSKHVYFGETSSSDNEEQGNEQEHSDIELDENESMNSELLDRVRLCQTLLNENNSRPAKTVVIERCPPTTVRVDSSDLITRCRDFLPLLTDSNQKLTEKSLAGEDIKIELDDDNDGPAIEMDLMFCPYGKTRANSSSSSSSTSPTVSDHENKLGETIDLANIVKRKKRNKKNRKKRKKMLTTKPTIIEIEPTHQQELEDIPNQVLTEER